MIHGHSGVKPALLKLKDGCDLSKEHYYLYFCGNNQASEGKDQCFNFKDSNGGRPDRYVPVKVAVFDEQATQQQDKLYRYGFWSHQKNLLLPYSHQIPNNTKSIQM